MKFEKLDFSVIDWQAVLPRFGVESSLIANPKRLGPCPIEGEGKTRFRFANKYGRGNWYCNQCGTGDGVRLVALMSNCDDAEAVRLIRNLDSGDDAKGPPRRVKPLVNKPKNIEKERFRLQKVWDQSVNPAGTWVDQYIQRRVPMFNMDWLSGSLRAHASLYHFDIDTKKVSFLPAMVARVCGLDGKPVTLHRTYLSADGFKAAVSPDQVKKQMTGVADLNGEAITLNVPVLKSWVLIVGEGIETGLALVASTQNRHLVKAALNAANLAKLKVSRDEYDCVIICADRDPLNKRHGWRVGEHYAEILRDRLVAEGFKVKLKAPAVDGTDYADLWLERCVKLKLVA
ncbi:toprim domain-containing protein (plasmid) [Polaromonas sp. P1-6]|nr:toprim domain-containing protein [Polaromonas sp. P1-6]